MSELNLTPASLKAIADILTPIMNDEETRQAIIDMAFVSTPLHSQIEWTGAGRVFVTRLVTKLQSYGEIEPGKHSLVTLLESANDYFGSDKQAQVKKLIAEMTASSQATASPEAELPQPTNESAHEHIFISYSSADKGFVEQMADDLMANGFKVWADTLDPKYGGLRSGELWQQGLANAINRAKVLVLAMSPDSLKSEWVRAEIKRGRETNRPIIPFVIRRLDDESIAIIKAIKLDAVQRWDTDKLTYKGALERLLNDLRGYFAVELAVARASANPFATLVISIERQRGETQKKLIIDLLEQAASDETAAQALSDLLGESDDAVIREVLRQMRNYPFIPDLPQALRAVLNKLTLHPDVAFADWARNILNKYSSR